MQLTDDELNIVPFGQFISRHAHGGRRTVVTEFAQAFRCQLANELDVRFVASAGVILKNTLIGISGVRLRMCRRPRFDLVLINPHTAFLDPRIKFRQSFAVIVFADTGIKTIVPKVDAANQVIPFYKTI